MLSSCHKSSIFVKTAVAPSQQTTGNALFLKYGNKRIGEDSVVF